MSHGLAQAAWADVPARPLVLVPLGSTEQHGPHLPMATDAIIAEATANALAVRLEEIDLGPALVAPVMPYGASGEHQGFPGTVSIGHEALRMHLIEMIRSLSVWAGRIVLVNAHGGNVPTLQSVLEQMRFEQHAVTMVACAFESEADAHAGHAETSVILHLRPGLVEMRRAEVGNTAPLQDLLPALVAQGVRAVSVNGVLGDPTTASSEEGARLFAGLVDRLTREVSSG